jgi:hypothetical protein
MNGLQHAGAFVLQFRAESDFESGRIEGRVEHIASGQTARFDSAAALLAILACLVKEAQGDLTLTDRDQHIPRQTA